MHQAGQCSSPRCASRQASRKLGPGMDARAGQRHMHAPRVRHIHTLTWQGTRAWHCYSNCGHMCEARQSCGAGTHARQGTSIGHALICLSSQCSG